MVTCYSVGPWGRQKYFYLLIPTTASLLLLSPFLFLLFSTFLPLFTLVFILVVVFLVLLLFMVDFMFSCSTIFTNLPWNGNNNWLCGPYLPARTFLVSRSHSCWSSCVSCPNWKMSLLPVLSIFQMSTKSEMGRHFLNFGFGNKYVKNDLLFLFLVLVLFGNTMKDWYVD